MELPRWSPAVLRAEVHSLHALLGGNARTAVSLAKSLSLADPRRIEEEVLFPLLDRGTPFYSAYYRTDRLAPAQADVLNILATAERPMRPSEIAAATYGVPPKEISVFLDRLRIDEQLVQRVGSSNTAAYYEVADPQFRLWALFRQQDPKLENVLSVRRFVRDWCLREVKDGDTLPYYRSFFVFFDVLKGRRNADLIDEPFEIRQAVRLLREGD